MHEVRGDLWSYPADAICITTNGFTRKDGCAVMGRGCALQAAKLWPWLPAQFGALLREKGNHVMRLRPGLYTFPVKHAWYEEASLELIERSCRELVSIVQDFEKKILVPRPGCGNGKRKWSEVEPLLRRHLDDRFLIIDFA